jgi:hypothetical protein
VTDAVLAPSIHDIEGVDDPGGPTLEDVEATWILTSRRTKMAKRVVTVKPSTKAAAQLKVKLAAMDGRTPSPAVLKIANAQPHPTGS